MWPCRNMEHQHPPVWMRHFLDIHSEPNFLKQSFFHLHWVREGARAGNLPRWPVGNAKQQMASTFIGKRNAILVQLLG